MNTMTKHCEIYRKNRMDRIAQEIGIGQIIKERYVKWPEKSYGNFICVTDTGVTIVKDEDHIKIVTMYVTTYKELVAVYQGANRIPQFLRKKVLKNQEKYIKNGKTIW